MTTDFPSWDLLVQRASGLGDVKPQDAWLLAVQAAEEITDLDAPMPATEREVRAVLRLLGSAIRQGATFHPNDFEDADFRL